MATATKQLDAIYQEITSRFSDHDSICVKVLDGDPPEKYEITYQLTGVYQDGSGQIQEKQSHAITINIPFGFPHFPPSCKPASELFHPDFDPAAICIGDFWEKDRSISDLILYIGQLISGEEFSRSNAFNEEAAQWYKDNKSRLPFEQTGFGDQIGTPPDTTPPELSLEADDEAQTPSEPEPEPEEADPPIEEDDTADPVVDFDPDKLKLLAKQKRYFELDGVLSSLTEGQVSGDLENLASQTADALQQAREIYNQGTEFEHQGNPGRALQSLSQVGNVVADYPGLEEDIERTTQAKELLGDWAQGAEEEDQPPPEGESAEQDAQPEEPEGRATRRADQRTLFEDTARKTSKIIPYALGIVVLIMACTVAFYYYLKSSLLTDAQAEFKECQAVLKQNRFNDAERQCEKAMDTVSQVQFFKGESRDRLVADMKAVLNSEKLQQGLAGNLLYEGEYLPKKLVRIIRQFKAFREAGDTHLAAEEWQEAADNYSQALMVGSKSDDIDQQLLFAVSKKKKTAEFYILYESGSELIARKQWVQATHELEKALEQLRTIAIADEALIVESITTQLASIALATKKAQGLAASEAGNYAVALAHFRDALASARTAYQADAPEIKELNELVVRSELYSTIKTGQDAFSESEWETAISNYEQAIMILEANHDLLSQANTEENRLKLSRIILQTSIIRDKQDAAMALKEERYLGAIEKLQAILATIERSQFRGEMEFTTIAKETRQEIKKAETDMLLADKIAYLEDNFKELFTTHYTGAPADALVNPRVVFEKRLGDKLLFRLEVIEIGRGRPLRLVMRYIHDLNNGTWSFYSGKG